MKSQHRAAMVMGCLFLLCTLSILLIPSRHGSEIPPAALWYNELTGQRSRGQALSPGDTIGIIAPASPALQEELDNELALLHAMGYKTKVGESATTDGTYLAGSDDLRARDINEFFRDDSVQAILCLRGGYGSARLLSQLDYQMIARHPKLFIGFSDITALHTALGQRSHLVTIHGPVLTSLTHDTTAYTLYQFEQGLTGTDVPGNVPMPDGIELSSLIPGTTEGRLCGGNITILASLAGTPYELRGDGGILFLEDTYESPYQLDRDLLQLYQSGLLSRVRGIVFGLFPDQDGHAAEREEYDDIIAHYASLAGKPAIKNFPAGHTEYNIFLPLGTRARLTASEDGTASLELLESPAVPRGR